METAKKKRRRNILFALAAVLLIALLTALPFLLEKNQQREQSKASILSTKAKTGSIRKTLSGTGTLTEQDAEDVSVPTAVRVTEYLVENGQFVKQGDPVATVDRISVMETISSFRETMEELETELETIRSGSDYTYISAPAPGRVKAVYASVGDSVQDVILKHGALAVMSLDGLMAVSFPAEAEVRIGQTVSVVLSDGTETPGRVETVIDGEATVTFSDKYGSIDETVTVQNAEGRRLGSGNLVVHSPWKAMATGGTVYSVYVEADRGISIYGTMLILSGTATGGNYEELAATHREYEDAMADLFRMYQDGILRAPYDGCVSGVDDSILELLSAEEDNQPTLSFLVNKEKWYSLIFLSDDELDNNSGSSDSPSGKDDPSGPDDPSGTNNPGGTDNPGGSDNPSEPPENTIKKYGAVTKKDDESKSITVKWTDGSEEIIPLSDSYYVVGIDGGKGKLDPMYYYNIEMEIVVDSVGNTKYIAYNFIATDILYTEEPSSRPDNPQNPKDNTFSGGGGITMSGAGSGGTGGSGGGGLPSGTQAAEEKVSSIETTTILSVTPHETVSVSITVDELDILYVHTGQKAQVTLDALQGQAFTGTITKVNTIASNEGGNSKYSAVVEMERNGYMLGGMNASANITVEERDGVLLIPAEALTEQDCRSVVYTAYDSRTETLSSPVTVETGLSDGLQVQILSGLQEGDTVWYSYYDTLEIKGLSGSFPAGRPNP